MNLRNRSHQGEAASRPSFTVVPTSTLQRQCACGQHTVSTGGDCEECKKTRQGVLQRATVNHSPTHAAFHSPGQPFGAKTGSFVQPSFSHDFSNVPVHANHPAKVPSARVNEFEDCPADWQKRANAALERGRPWIANVITGLVNLPDPIPVPVAIALNRHFHTTRRDHIREIIGHFNTIYSAMNAPIDFECETECDDNVAAYVYSIWTDLHLCPIWYSLGPDSQANIIIHEIAHDAANRDDEAYIWQPAYGTLSAQDAIDNADSYSNFAEEANIP